MEPLEKPQTQLPISQGTSEQSIAGANGEATKEPKDTLDSNIKDLSFKEASTELEGIVRALEAGDMELEQSLVAYRRGVELVKNLSMRLEKAEQEVSTLTAEIFPPDANE